MADRRARFAIETFVSVVAFFLIGWAVLVDDAWIATHATRRYCFTEHATIDRAHVARVVAIVMGILMLLVARRRLGRRVEGKTPSEVAASVARFAFAIVLSFVVTDLALRLRAREQHPPPLGFAHEPKQSLVVHSKTGRDI